MKLLIKLLPLVVIGLLIASCTSSRVGTTASAMYDVDDLYAHSWDLTELNGVTVNRSGDAYSYITFTPGTTSRIYGYTGCNYLGGTLSFSGTNGVTLTPTLTTKKVCTGNTENAYITSLRGVDTWAIKDNKLVMYDNGRTVARFTPSTYTNNKLYGNWQLAYIDDDKIVFDEVYPSGKRPSVVFMADKAVVSGTTGCNTYSCPVRINSNGIAFADCSIPSKVECADKGEDMFLRRLGYVNNYRFDDDDTLVFVTDDNTIMRFTRVK